MKLIVTLIFVLLFVSCLKNETTNQIIEDDPNVFVFDRIFTFNGSSLDDENLSLTLQVKMTFTISDEDNCTYYILEEEYDFKGQEDLFATSPNITGFLLMDKVGYEIYSFDPITKNPKILGKKSIHSGKVPRYYDNLRNLTRSKLESTRSITVAMGWREKRIK